MNILAMSDFALVMHTHSEHSELIGELHVGDGNAYNDHLHGVLRVNEYDCEDFYFCDIGSIEEIKLFFDSLDFLLGQTGVNSFCFALNCTTTWRGQYLKNVRKIFNEYASTIFHDNGALDNLKNNFEKQRFIDIYLRISQALNFAENGLIQFTEEGFLY